MVMKIGRALSCILIVLQLFFSANAALAQPIVNAAWSQIIGQTELDEQGDLAPLNLRMRFVLDQNEELTCDDFTISLKDQVVLLTKWSVREVFDIFGTTVCDAPMSENWPEASLVLSDGTPAKVKLTAPNGAIELRNVTFSGPSAIGRRQLAQNRGDKIEVAVLGNTGCLGNSGAIGDQDCADPSAWPYAKIADHIRREGLLPDFVIHLGNSRYDASNDNSWESWQREFFGPAQALLLDVPWVFTRGSQEDCNPQYAGAGWYLFFGPVGEGREVDMCKRRRSHVPVHYFDVAIKSTLNPQAPHRFVIVDTGPHPDASLSKNFSAALALAQSDWGDTIASSSIITHRPIWGLDTFSDFMQQQSDPQVLSAFSRAVKTMEDSPCAPFSAEKCGLKNIVSSHQRAFENIEFLPKDNEVGAWALPQQVVVGNSGVKLETPQPNAAFSFEAAGMLGRRNNQACGQVVNWSNDPGYMVMTRDLSPLSETQSGWVKEVRVLSDGETGPEFKSIPLGNGIAGKSNYSECQ